MSSSENKKGASTCQLLYKAEGSQMTSVSVSALWHVNRYTNAHHCNHYCCERDDLQRQVVETYTKHYKGV